MSAVSIGCALLIAAGQQYEKGEQAGDYHDSESAFYIGAEHTVAHVGHSDGLNNDGTSAKGGERRNEYELNRERKRRMHDSMNAIREFKCSEQDQAGRRRCEGNGSSGICQHGKSDEVNTDPDCRRYRIFDAAVDELKQALLRVVDSCGTDGAGLYESFCMRSAKAKGRDNSIEQRRTEHIPNEHDTKLRVFPLVSGDVGK